jgi:hypothetical protein
MSDASSANSGSDTNPLQTLDIAGVDDIVRIQHTGVDRLLKHPRKHFRSTHAQTRIQNVPQTVTQEVKPEHDDHDG